MSNERKIEATLQTLKTDPQAAKEIFRGLETRPDAELLEAFRREKKLIVTAAQGWQ